MDQEFNRIIQ